MEIKNNAELSYDLTEEDLVTGGVYAIGGWDDSGEQNAFIKTDEGNMVRLSDGYQVVICGDAAFAELAAHVVITG